jgi:cephalosporin hydroxylase
MNKLTIDMDRGEVTLHDRGVERTLAMGDPEAFGAISRAWLRSGWDTKYVYSFTWMGRPVIQLPEDMIRIQEVIHTVQPDVILETGVAHGGSLVFYASLCKAMERGRVVGIDIEIRPHNRKAIEEHPLFPYITLVEGSSTDPAIVAQAASLIRPDERVLVLLDSNHTRAHVLDELRAYAPMVTIGSYAVATDGIMELVAGGPRTQADWSWNNPKRAAEDFVAEDARFVIEEPAFAFNEGVVEERVSYWPGAFVKRIA